MELGIAGWSLHREIIQDKKITLLDYPRVCAVQFGVKTIELCSVFFPETGANYLNQLRNELETLGLRCTNMAVDMGNLSHLDDKIRKTDVEALKQWFHVARAIGCESIRINSGRTDVVDQAVMDRVVEGYRELARVAEFTGVYLLIENHGGASSLPSSIKYFLDKVNSRWFRTCPDFGNFAPDVRLEGLKLMAPLAYSVHAKTWNFDESGRVWRINRNTGAWEAYDFGECLQIIKDAGYKGPLCVEFEGEGDERDGIRRTLELLRRKL